MLQRQTLLLLAVQSKQKFWVFSFMGLKKKIGFVLLLIAIFTGITAWGLAHIFRGSTRSVASDTSYSAKVVALDTSLLTALQADTSSANLDRYVSSADKELADVSLSAGAKKLILLRKASVVADIRRGDQSVQTQRLKSANETLESFILVPNATGTALSYKDAAITALGLSVLQCCSLSSENMSIAPFGSYTRYRAAGYGDTLSRLLAVDDLTQLVSSSGRKNLINQANAADAELKIINGYAHQLSSTDLVRIRSELATNVSYYQSLSTDTIKSLSVSDQFTLRRILAAYDVYVTSESEVVSTATNKDIDARYESYASILNGLVASGNSVDGAREHIFYNDIRYLESLERRYGKNVDQRKITSVVQDLLLNVRASDETQSIASWYLIGVKKLDDVDPDAARMYMPELNFYRLAKTNKEVATYLQSIGISN